MKEFIDSQKIIPTISSSMTFSEFVQGFLANLDHELGMLINELGNVSGGRVLGRQLSILFDYLDLKYREGGSSKSEAEMLVEHNINKRPSNWDSLFRQYVREPFVACLRNSGREEFIGIHERLSGIIRALNAKELEKMIFGGQRPTNRTISFVVDFYGLSPIEYEYRTFKDSQLESFYANDGIKIPKNVATPFFNFFSKGEASPDDKEYDATKYYGGGMPVRESRIRSYFKDVIDKSCLDKLLTIIDESDRFIRAVDEDGVPMYSLKVQYLSGIPDMMVAIIYANGGPVTNDALYERIVDLSKKYPMLVEKPKKSSLGLRRHPALASAGDRGTRTLLIWGEKKEHVYDAIRRIIREEYERNGNKPVKAKDVQSKLKALNYNYYNLRTIKTYITNANCKPLRGGYVPENAPVKGHSRKLVGKSYKVQRMVARHLLDEGRPLKYTDLISFLSEDGTEIGRRSLEQFLHERKDVFVEQRDGRNVFVALTSRIKGKRDINVVIAEPLSREPEYRTSIRNEIIRFLLTEGERTQFYLVELFKKKLPTYLKAPDSEIRLILRDEKIFTKRKEGSERIIGLTEVYQQKWLLNHSESRSEEVREPSYSWEELKKNLLQKFSADFFYSSKALSDDDVENMHVVMARGEDLHADSTFSAVLKDIYSYLIGSTNFKERDLLRNNLLNALELYLKNFYYLKFHGDYSTPFITKQKGLGKIRYELQDKNLLPNPDSDTLTPHEGMICQTVERLNTARNKQDHPWQRTDYSEKKISNNIHDSLVLFLYLARELN